MPGCKEAVGHLTKYSWSRVKSHPVALTAEGTTVVLGLSHLHTDLRHCHSHVTKAWTDLRYLDVFLMDNHKRTHVRHRAEPQGRILLSTENAEFCVLL